MSANVDQHWILRSVGDFIDLGHRRVRIGRFQDDPGFPNKVDHTIGTELYSSLAAIDSNWLHVRTPRVCRT